MVDRFIEDLASTDRDVALASGALSAWREGLRKDWGAYAERDPLTELRYVSGRTTAEALANLHPISADLPLRDALVGWVQSLVLARIAMPSDVAIARVTAEAAGAFRGEPPRHVSWRQAWRGVASATSAAETALWIPAAADCAAAVAAVRRGRAERRAEAARRLGLTHPWQTLAPGGRDAHDAIKDSAARLLDRTDALSRATWRESPGTPPTPASVLHGALARESEDGWPARLSPQWIRDAFRGEPRDRRIDLPELPRATGAASFARALYAFGCAVSVAAIPAWLPFAIGHEPGALSEHRMGFLFASLPTQAIFHTRVLHVGTRTARAQARALARTALLDARLHAARILLGDETSMPSVPLFEEVTARLFGRPLDPRFCGAWPEARDDEPGRWLALLEARGLAEDLRERHDADWFHNPRAWETLVEAAPAPRPTPERAVWLDASDRLAQRFEESLG